ncbi:MAG: nicotinate-nucleotide--dimethylbenzimidazole phosphoribosyltransferase [Aquisalimonadaceae bacterium]
MNETPAWLQALPAPDACAAEAAMRRQAVLTKPPGSLGRLEALAVTLAGQQGRDRPALDRVRITVFAADHGVCAEGVSAFPQEVTAQMVRNFAAGGAAISVLARIAGATLEVVDVGTVSSPGSLQGVLDARIAPGTGNLAEAPAMTTAQLEQALQIGEHAAARAEAAGAELFIGGDMGIGNTTSAAAVACALLGVSPAALVGRGTGVDDAGLIRKREAVARGLARHGDNREPLAVLSSLGGFEIAALAGAMLGCARRRIPVLVDGFIVSVAALAATRVQPALHHWLHFSHRSEESGHGLVLDALHAQPLLDLGMRLGEGSGAAVALPLLRAACALHGGMASFDEAGVADGG